MGVGNLERSESCILPPTAQPCLRWHKLKPLEVLSIIVTVRSQILCHLTAKMSCGLKSLTHAHSEVTIVRMP